jgi:hypothetical protein
MSERYIHAATLVYSYTICLASSVSLGQSFPWKTNANVNFTYTATTWLQ